MKKARLTEEQNRAIAQAMVLGPCEALELAQPLARGGLADYRLAHMAEADLLTRLQRPSDATYAYKRALDLSTGAERPVIEKRLGCLRRDRAIR